MPILKYIAASISLIFVLYACGGGGDNSPLTDAELLDQRPFEMKIPQSYDASTPLPLIVVLHGLGGNGAQILSYFRMSGCGLSAMDF